MRTTLENACRTQEEPRRYLPLGQLENLPGIAVQTSIWGMPSEYIRVVFPGPEMPYEPALPEILPGPQWTEDPMVTRFPGAIEGRLYLR